MKLKDGKTCRCASTDRHLCGTRWCRYQQCTILICPGCGRDWAEWGPIDCPHKKNENGTLRWYKYPDMDSKPHVAAKRNATTRRHNQKHR